ncbi:NERD domain-containing protein [Kineosporiaceae bacterium SCSIO 59966]|nr:NERD domain-containing protein [Kineosporiaceae bacterium SCSIO 59966]
MSVTGAAGGGAEDMARRAAAREAELVEQLARARRNRQAWEAGAAGERAVARALEALGENGWRVLHDVHWPGRPKANLDHVAIGPGGVIVIDAKNWSGTVSVHDGVLRQNGYRRDQVPVAVCAAAGAVTALLTPQHRSAVRAVVCLIQQPLNPQTLPPGAVLVGLTGLAPWLRSLPPVLRPEEVSALHASLRRHLAGPHSPELATTAALAQRAPTVLARPTGLPRNPPRMPPGRRGPSVGRGVPSSEGGRGLKAAVAVGVIVMSLLWLNSLTAGLLRATAPTVPAVPTVSAASPAPPGVVGQP